jgi:hypothetical protein
VTAAGGDRRLFAIWMRTPQAQGIGTREDETFWAHVLAWLAKNPPEGEQLGPILDYVAHRRRADASFSMTGRTLPAVTRGMLEWHRELAQDRALHGARFEPSGLRGATFDVSTRSADGGTKPRVWRVEEILTGNRLADEGRRMGHCVYSYASRIARRECSIWSMTYEDGTGPTGRWAMLTIEVRTESRRVVQARGRFNRAATSAEHVVLVRWAGLNGLTVCV